MRKTALCLLTLVAVLGVAGLAVAAGDGGHGADSGALLKDFLYRCLNFAVTFGLLAYFVTKPLRKGLAGRREGLEKELAEARRAKEEAEARFAEYDRKLSQAAEEIETIQTELRREGELERERILADARQMAEKIKSEAQHTAAGEVSRARSELRREATELAVALAEDLLQKNFTAEDQDRLVNEYTQKVGELH